MLIIRSDRRQKNQPLYIIKDGDIAMQEVATMKIRRYNHHDPDYVITECGYYYQIADKDKNAEIFDDDVAKRIGAESVKLGRPVVVYTIGITSEYVNKICNFIISNGYKAIYGKRIRKNGDKTILLGYKIMVSDYDDNIATIHPVS